MSEHIINDLFSSNQINEALKDYKNKVDRHIKSVQDCGQKIGVCEKRLSRHDMSKYFHDEFYPYAFKFHLDSDIGFDDALKRHYLRNDHHIEYWEFRKLAIGRVAHNGYDKGLGVYMPDDAIKEMVADWMSASLVYEGYMPNKDNWEWGNKNIPKMMIRLNHFPDPEVTCRGFLSNVLYSNNLIDEQLKIDSCRMMDSEFRKKYNV